MKWVASAWIEDSDAVLVASVRKYGVRAIAAEIGLSPGMLSRWIRRRTGMGQNHVKHLLRAIKKPSTPPPTGAAGEGEGRG
jgi:methylphosphotriester-DNA--protein-cysteine methyltransferase